MNIRTFALFAGASLAIALSSGEAAATTIIKDPNPPRYKLEIEPKLNLGFFGLFDYGGNGWGPGVRFSIPLMSPGFVKKINDSVAIGFGADFMRYSGYKYYRDYCPNKNAACVDYYNHYDASFWALHLPVVMQWNFWLTDKWSVFGEAGVTLRHAFYRDDPYYNTYCSGGFCRQGSANDFYFTFFAGGRFHFNDNLALTFRIGHPIDASIGLSIFL